jgi:hypothetical protein
MCVCGKVHATRRDGAEGRCREGCVRVRVDVASGRRPGWEACSCARCRPPLGPPLVPTRPPPPPPTPLLLRLPPPPHPRGPSGSGKTSLLSVISGRAPRAVRTAGRVTVNGQPFTKQAKRRVGFVLQDDLLYEVEGGEGLGFGCFLGRGLSGLVGWCRLVGLGGEGLGC